MKNSWQGSTEQMDAYSIFKPREGVKKHTKKTKTKEPSTNPEQMACFAFMVWKTLPNSLEVSHHRVTDWGGWGQEGKMLCVQWFRADGMPLFINTLRDRLQTAGFEHLDWSQMFMLEVFNAPKVTRVNYHSETKYPPFLFRRSYPNHSLLIIQTRPMSAFPPFFLSSSYSLPSTSSTTFLAQSPLLILPTTLCSEGKFSPLRKRGKAMSFCSLALFSFRLSKSPCDSCLMNSNTLLKYWC